MAAVEPVTLEMVCRSENRILVATTTFKPSREPLSAAEIVAGLKIVDPGRCPKPNSIHDGEQIRCGRCKGSIFFRDGKGNLWVANPGTISVQG